MTLQAFGSLLEGYSILPKDIPLFGVSMMVVEHVGPKSPMGAQSVVDLVTVSP